MALATIGDKRLSIGGRLLTMGDGDNYVGFVMADYLTELVPDYAGVISITPQQVLMSEPQFNQEILFTDSNTPVTISHSDDVFFVVSPIWSAIRSYEADEIMKFFLSTERANRFHKSILWEHPEDGHTYVVKFINAPAHKIHPNGRADIANVVFLVLGVYNGS